MHREMPRILNPHPRLFRPVCLLDFSTIPQQLFKPQLPDLYRCRKHTVLILIQDLCTTSSAHIADTSAQPSPYLALSFHPLRLRSVIRLLKYPPRTHLYLPLRPLP